MIKLRMMFLAAAASFLATPGAHAALITCASGTGLPCFTSGNDHEGNVEGFIQTATGSAVDLTLYGKSDDASASLFNFTGLGTKKGTWDVIDPLVKVAYITVKAGPGYAIYDVGGLNSGDWSTLGILNPGGQQPKLSHLSFWTVPSAAVPEPATWLTLIAGFGLVGTGFRLRRAQPKLA